LTRLGKIIRRNAGDDNGPAAVVELEIFAVGPHISRIMRDKNRQVANDPDIPFARIVTQQNPLAEEEKLKEFLCLDFAVEFVARAL